MAEDLQRLVLHPVLRDEGSAFVTVKKHEGKTTGVAGDGAAAWNALEERFDANTKDCLLYTSDAADE